MKKLTIIILLLFTFSSHATRIDVFDDSAQSLGPIAYGIQSCTSQQGIKVREAEMLLRQRLDQIEQEWPQMDLASVKRDFIDPNHRQWIPGSRWNQTYETYWQDMARVFKQMRNKIAGGLNFQCQGAQDNQCRKGTIAYVMVIFGRPREVVYLCPAFFEDGMYTSTLFHELSHYAANTEDYVLDWSNLEKSDLKRGAKDAYHLETFMNNPIELILKRTIWLWWWPKIALSF